MKNINHQAIEKRARFYPLCGQRGKEVWCFFPIQFVTCRRCLKILKKG